MIIPLLRIIGDSSIFSVIREGGSICSIANLEGSGAAGGGFFILTEIKFFAVLTKLFMSLFSSGIFNNSERFLENSNNELMIPKNSKPARASLTTSLFLHFLVPKRDFSVRANQFCYYC